MLYKAFLSYSHAGDGKLAPALQSALHRFAKPWYRLRSLRIFRDKTSLAVSASLWPTIKQALAEAEYFLFIASPEAAQSEWIERELMYWRKRRDSETVLLVLTGGEVVWDPATGDFDWTRTSALPLCMKGFFEYEPLYVDLRWARSTEHLSLTHPRFRDSVAEIAAALHGRAKDELIGDDVQQHRRTKRIVWLVSLGLFALALGTSLAAYIAVQRGELAEQRRQESERRRLHTRAQQLIAESRLSIHTAPQRGLLLAVEAYRFSQEAKRTSFAEATETLRAHLTETGGVPIRIRERAVMDMSISPDRRWLATGSASGRINLLDISKKKLVMSEVGSHGKAISSIEFDATGTGFATSSVGGATRLWIPSRDLPHTPVDLVEDAGSGAIAFSRDHKWFASSSKDDNVWLWDLTAPTPHPIALGVRNEEIPSACEALGGDSIIFPYRSTKKASITPGKCPLSGHVGRVETIRFSPDGQWLASGSGDHTIRLWNLHKLGSNPLVLVGHKAKIVDLAFHPTGRWLVSGSDDKTARLWRLPDDPSGGTVLQSNRVLDGHEQPITQVRFSPDGRWIATSSEDNTARVWPIDEAETTARVLRGHHEEVRALAFDASSTWLATGSQDKTVRLWYLPNPETYSYALRGCEGPVNTLNFADTEGKLYAGSTDGTVRMWQLASFKAEPISRRMSRGRISFLQINDNGRWLVAGGSHPIDYMMSPHVPDDSSLSVWDLTKPNASPRLLHKHQDDVTVVALDPNGRWLVTGDRKGRIWIRNLLNLDSEALIIDGHEPPILSAAFDVQGKWLATGGHRSVKIWTMTPPDTEAVFVAPVDENVSSIAFGSRARWLAAGTEDGRLRLWDMQAWEDGPRTFNVFRGPVMALAFAPNGEWLVAGGSNAKALRIWSLAPTVEGPTELGRHEHVVRELSFSADGRWLASAGDTDALMLWNLDQGTPKLTALRYREPRVTALAFDATSKLLAFGGIDGTVHVQELSALEMRPMRISAHQGFVTAMHFDPRGGRLATGGEDGIVRIWRQNIEELIELSCKVAGRNLTCDEWTEFMGDRPYAPTCSDLPYPSCPATSTD